MRVRRLKREAAQLEITAFINLIVVLVPFLLSTAVFSKLSVLDLKLPAAAASPVLEQLKPGELKLEVVLRADALEVGDRIGGLIQRLPHTAQGPDLNGLSALLHQVKARFPAQTDASVLAEPEIPYERLVQVLDAVRSTRSARSGQLSTVELFPAISMGDAPVRAKAARP